MHVEGGFDVRCDLAQKGDEILRPMLGLAAGNHLAGRHIDCSEEIQGAVPQVVMGPALRLAEVHRQDGLRALNPTTSRIFSTSCGSGESLKLSVRCGCKRNVRQMRPTIV